MKEIREFIENRPEVKAAYAYGSKVFKQENAKTNNSLIDLIFVVDDIKKWHLENLEQNPNDYSFIGKNFFEIANKEKIKGNTNIAYISDIKENGLKFKFGTIEYQDLLLNLQTWDKFYVPGRFQKTIEAYKEDVELNRAILINRKKALLVASYLINKGLVTKEELFEKIVGLSYAGDPRMKFGETPDKVKNIVEGSFDEYNKMYDLNVPYLKDLGNDVLIKSEYLIDEYNNLPFAIKKYIETQELMTIPDAINEYLIKLNHDEASKMMKKAILTNGIVRSAAYGARKLQKGINGRIEQIKKTA